jgi:hypothetical protein
MYDKYVSMSMTMKCYGWTKWGGAREGMVKEDLEEWYCQACGEKQIRVLPSYMFPTDDEGREFVRVCTLCKAKSIIGRLTKWQELMHLLR